MSRSYKKHPFCKDGNRSSKEDKRIANGIVRAKNKRIVVTIAVPRSFKNSNGEYETDFIRSRGAYRKVYCSYDINDYITRETEEENRRWWDEHSILYDPSFNGRITFKDYKQKWEKLYKRK